MIPTWPVASGSLVLGFLVAEATGVRPLGGIVMIVALAWCIKRWLGRSGAVRAVALVLIYIGSFVLSHLVADTLTAVPSVLLAAAITGGAAWAIADAARHSVGSPA